MLVIQYPDAEEGGSGMQGYSCLNNDFEASPGYILNVKKTKRPPPPKTKSQQNSKIKEHWREGQMFKNKQTSKQEPVRHSHDNSNCLLLH